MLALRQMARQGLGHVAVTKASGLACCAVVSASTSHMLSGCVVVQKDRLPLRWNRQQ